MLMPNFPDLFSGLIGAIIGGILTCLYNEYSQKRKYRLDIHLQAFKEISVQMPEVILDFSHLLSYIKSGINISEKDKFIETTKVPHYSLDDYLSLCYAFSTSATKLIETMDSYQLVFIKYRKYYNSIESELTEACNIIPLLITDIEKSQVNQGSLYIKELQTIELKSKEAMWNLQIDMENYFSGIMHVHINKNIPPDDTKFPSTVNDKINENHKKPDEK